jgi:hypothetical protein
MNTGLFVDEQGVDIPVEIVQYLDSEHVRVRSKIGSPFGCDTSLNFLQACTEPEKTVKMSDVKVIQFDD